MLSRKKLAYLGGSVIVLSTIGAIIQPRIKIIKEGEVGVKVSLGKINKHPIKEGLVIYSETFEDLYVFSARVEKVDFRKAQGNEIKALTSDGLEVGADITVLYKVNPEKAPYLYRDFGLNYVDKLITPIVRSTFRDIVSKYNTESLYTSQRIKFQGEIEEAIKDRIQSFSKSYIEVKDVLLRNIDLPKKVEEAIEDKIKAKQEAEKMKYVLQKEKLESERKIVEAKGIAQANKIISESLTPEYLSWYYIKTLEKMSEKTQTTIILPYDSNLVPMLNIKDTHFIYQNNATNLNKKLYNPKY